MQLDSVQIGAADLQSAVAEYETLLGVAATRCADGRVRFQLRTGAVELEVAEPGVRSIQFVLEPGSTPPAGESFGGLAVRFVGAVTSPAPSPAEAAAAIVSAIDHVVVHTMQPERALALWRDRLGLRLALDREFPDRGLRLLFFRSNHMTLEYACMLNAAGSAAEDRFYGVSYRVRDIQSCRERLLAASIDVSPVRTGMKPGTHVVTVRSGTAGVPTLLIEDPSRAEPSLAV